MTKQQKARLWLGVFTGFVFAMPILRFVLGLRLLTDFMLVGGLFVLLQLFKHMGDTDAQEQPETEPTHEAE